MMRPPDWIGGDQAELRALRDRQPEVVNPVLPNDVVLEPPAPGDHGIVCRPTSPRPGVVLHFHGGGFVVGSPFTHRVVGAWLAHLSQRLVYLCAWPLAPEHVLPEQPYAAAAILDRAIKRFGASVTLSGDSAGAMMAAWAYAFSPAARRTHIDGLLSLYGAFGGRPAATSAGKAVSGLEPGAIAAYYQRLDPDRIMARDAAFRPLDPDFPLPPRTAVIGAALDPILSDSEALKRAHPKARLFLVPGAEHGFLSTPRPADAFLAIVAKAAEFAASNGKSS